MKLLSISMVKRNFKYSTKSEGGVNLHDFNATNTKNKQCDILPFFIASKVKTVWRLRCLCGVGGHRERYCLWLYQSVVRALYSHQSRAICARAAFASSLSIIIYTSVQCFLAPPVTIPTDHSEL